MKGDRFKFRAQLVIPFVLLSYNCPISDLRFIDYAYSRPYLSEGSCNIGSRYIQGFCGSHMDYEKNFFAIFSPLFPFAIGYVTTSSGASGLKVNLDFIPKKGSLADLINCFSTNMILSQEDKLFFICKYTIFLCTGLALIFQRYSVKKTDIKNRIVLLFDPLSILEDMSNLLGINSSWLNQRVVSFGFVFKFIKFQFYFVLSVCCFGILFQIQVDLKGKVEILVYVSESIKFGDMKRAYSSLKNFS